jgi:D-alanyl-D-alanine carboxypeptidase
MLRFLATATATALVVSFTAVTFGGALAHQPQAGRAEARGDVRARLQAVLDAWHTEAAGSFPGATAAVALTDGTTIGLAVGVADRETKRAMSPSDLMLQGSVGKTYVSAVALQLVHERRIALDDRIEKYLGTRPWFAKLPNAREITVRMLMNHTSGLVRYEFSEKFTQDLTRQPDKVWKPEELIAYILGTEAPFAAGQGWEYSDTNYIVLGLIIEQVSSSTFYDQAKTRLFTPLKLMRTVPSDSRVIPGLVQGYAGPRNPFGGVDAMIVNGKFAINPQFEWCGGGFASTTEDLAKWAMALYQGRAFDPSLMPEFLRGVPAKLGPEAKYGLGVIIKPSRFGVTYGHSGFFPGYITEMAFFPDHKIAIAVQVNTSTPRAAGRPLARVIADLAEVVIPTSSSR